MGLTFVLGFLLCIFQSSESILVKLSNNRPDPHPSSAKLLLLSEFLKLLSKSFLLHFLRLHFALYPIDSFAGRVRFAEGVNFLLVWVVAVASQKVGCFLPLEPHPLIISSPNPTSTEHTNITQSYANIPAPRNPPSSRFFNSIAGVNGKEYYSPEREKYAHDLSSKMACDKEPKKKKSSVDKVFFNIVGLPIPIPSIRSVVHSFFTRHSTRSHDRHSRQQWQAPCRHTIGQDRACCCVFLLVVDLLVVVEKLRDSSHRFGNTVQSIITHFCWLSLHAFTFYALEGEV